MCFCIPREVVPKLRLAVDSCPDRGQARPRRPRIEGGVGDFFFTQDALHPKPNDVEAHGRVMNAGSS